MRIGKALINERHLHKQQFIHMCTVGSLNGMKAYLHGAVCALFFLEGLCVTICFVLNIRQAHCFIMFACSVSQAICSH